MALSWKRNEEQLPGFEQWWAVKWTGWKKVQARKASVVITHMVDAATKVRNTSFSSLLPWPQPSLLLYAPMFPVTPHVATQIILVSRQNFCVAWLSWNSLYRPGWVHTQICLPLPQVLGLKACPRPLYPGLLFSADPGFHLLLDTCFLSHVSMFPKTTLF